MPRRISASPDLLTILSDYSPRMINGQIRMECPFRENHTDGSGKMSFFISPDIGAYHCFSCGAKGGAVKLLTNKFGVNYFTAVELVKLSDYTQKSGKEFDLDIIWSVDNPPEEFTKRMYYLKTLKHFKVGTDDSGKIVIPYYKDFNSCKDLVGYQTREYYPSRRVKNSDGFAKKEYLYNLDTSYDYVVLVEGQSDVWRIYQHGYNACGLMGADMSSWQASQIRQFKRVYLALDNDEAGRRATEICYELLKNHSEVLLIPYMTKDPGECLSPKVWAKYFKQATDYFTYSMEMYINWDGYEELRNKVLTDLRHRTHGD